MCPAIGSGIGTGDAPYSYWLVFSRSLEAVPEAFAKVNSVHSFSKVANIVIFPLVAKKYISFKYEIKEHLPRLLWTWYPLESEQAPRYPTCYLEKWRVPEEECPQDLSEVACYHCNI